MVKILPKLLTGSEILGLILSVTGYGFKVLHLAGADQMLMIGLMTLATTYFLSGFVLVPAPDDSKQKSFVDLMPVVLRKILYIGLSVFLVGFLFGLLHLAGANEMLLMGIGTLLSGTLLAMVLVLGKRERMALLQSPLIRSVVVLVFFLVSYLR
jgi:hypothetical protein